jgi:hypothetical protein
MRPGHVADAACGVVDELRTWLAREAAGCAESSALIQTLNVERQKRAEFCTAL